MEHDHSSYFCRGPDDFCWGPAPAGPTLVTGSPLTLKFGMTAQISPLKPTGQVDKNWDFKKLRWRTAAIVRIDKWLSHPNSLIDHHEICKWTHIIFSI